MKLVVESSSPQPGAPPDGGLAFGWSTIFLSIVGLTSLGISQPVFDLVGADPSFFVAHQSKTLDIVLFGLGVLLLPAIVAFAIAAVSRAAGPKGFAVVSSAVVGLLGGYLIATIIKRPITWGTWALVVTVVVLAALIGTGFFRLEPLRAGLRVIGYLAPLPLLWFLFGGPVSTLVGASDASAVGQGASEDNQLVIVVLDELPAASLVTSSGEIDAVKLPNFARLGEMSTWYRETATVSSRTTWAVPAISTGKNPSGRETPPDSSAYPKNTFTYLSPSHVLDADEFLTRLCPQKLCEEGPDDQVDGSLLYSDGLVAAGHALLPGPFAEANLAPLGDQWAGFTRVDDEAADQTDGQTADAEVETVAERMAADGANDQAARFRAFTQRAATRVEPTVSYLHVALPHVPWERLPDGRRYNGVGLPGLGDDGWVDDKATIDNSAFRYLLQLEFVDTLIGELLDELETSPTFDETMLIVTSDHGAAFRPELPRRSPTGRTAGELAHVPLFVKYPGQQTGEISDRRSATIDILPTIAEVLGVELGTEVDGEISPPDIDGISLRQPAPDDRRLWLWGKGVEVPLGPSLSEASDRTRKSLARAVPEGQRASESYLHLAGRNDFDLDTFASLPVEGELDITNQDQYLGLTTSSEFLPARFFGHLRGGAAEGGDIVVMINGVPAGAGPVQENRRTMVMLDPAVLDAAAGAEIEFSAAHRTPDGWVQLGIRGRSPMDIVLDDSGDPVSITSDGRTWGVENTTGVGNIDQVPETVTGEADGRVFGWAADPESGELPVAVLLMERAEVVGRPNQVIPRQDVADSYNDQNLVDSGWSFLFTNKRAVENLYIIALYADDSFQVLRQN